MSKRKISEDDSNDDDDDFEEHYREKIRRFGESDDDDDDDNVDKDEEDGSVLKSERGKNSNFNSQDESETEEKETPIGKGNIGYNIMKKLGYRKGVGLGKHENGIVEPVGASKQKGTRGLGFNPSEMREAVAKYDPNEEDEIFFDEEVIWLINDHRDTLEEHQLKSWVRYGPCNQKVTEDSPFCEPRVIRYILKSKNVLESFNEKEKLHGVRANPFEAIRNGIFLNRAAMKMANMDAILDRMFTEPKTKNGSPAVGPNELLYFADVCAGPGGFSEYVLYRKKWEAKGFGFTLKSENDFKLDQFIAGPPETFEPHYGERGDGDVFAPENITSFRDHVMKYTDNKGVHFMMADGGFPIKENLSAQEIICKKLYLCQCIVALFIVRPGGHFVVKLFDIFTEFSVGLIYLMYRSFDQILIVKPNTSRPANSERYLVCKWKRDDCDQIASHLFNINYKVPKCDETHKQDVLELVPTHLLENDEKFFNYVKTSNIKLGERQIKSLLKMAAFSENLELTETRQQTLRENCLKKWNIPVGARAEPKKVEPRSKWEELVWSQSLLESDCCNKKNKITSIESFAETVKDWKYSWIGVVLSQVESEGTCSFYLGLGRGNIHCYTGGKWTKQNYSGLGLPANTIIYGEVVKEFIGSGRSQRKISALHIFDGLFLGGVDIRRLPFSKRKEKCALFAKALFKETFPVRVKEHYYLGWIDQLWGRLALQKTKSSSIRCLGIPLSEDRFYKAAGVMFIRDMKDSWNRCFSNSQKCFYAYEKRHESVHETKIPESSHSTYYADFEECFNSRLIWWWDDGVVVHKEQRFNPDPNKMQRSEVDDLVRHMKF